MKTYDSKKNESKSQAVASSLTTQKGNNKPLFQLVDNRPDAIAQRNLQELANAYTSKINTNSLLSNHNNPIQCVKGFGSSTPRFQETFMTKTGLMGHKLGGATKNTKSHPERIAPQLHVPKIKINSNLANLPHEVFHFEVMPGMSRKDNAAFVEATLGQIPITVQRLKSDITFVSTRRKYLTRLIINEKNRPFGTPPDPNFASYKVEHKELHAEMEHLLRAKHKITNHRG